MVKKLERINETEKAKWKHLNIPEETHAKLKELGVRENAKMSELVRYLVDLAHSNKIDFE